MKKEEAKALIENLFRKKYGKTAKYTMPTASPFGKDGHPHEHGRGLDR